MLRHRQGEDTSLSIFMTAPYQPRMFYWELFFFARRLFLLVVSFAPLGSGAVLNLFVSLCLLASLALHAVNQPFIRKLDNWVETSSLVLLIASFAVGLGGSRRADERAGLAILIINTLFLAPLIAIFLFKEGPKATQKPQDGQELEDKKEPLLQAANDDEDMYI
jgi:hypothetical protein